MDHRSQRQRKQKQEINKMQEQITAMVGEVQSHKGKTTKATGGQSVVRGKKVGGKCGDSKFVSGDSTLYVDSKDVEEPSKFK